MVETRSRSIFKTISWRILATFITATVTWIITGNYIYAVEIGVLDSLVKLVAYYGHERTWNRIPLGKSI